MFRTDGVTGSARAQRASNAMLSSPTGRSPLFHMSYV
jgi:hypothetical protein